MPPANCQFNETVQQASERILKTLQKNPRLTAWDLKVELKLSNSLLYLALGWLAAEGKLFLTPHELTYRIEMKESHEANPTPSQP